MLFSICIPLSPRTSVPAAAACHIGNDRSEQDQGCQRILEGNVEAHGKDTFLHDGDDEGADHGAEDGGEAAGHGGSAHDAGRDGFVVESVALDRLHGGIAADI